ncbi:unnamed protein product [Arabidopsis halleri]
MIGCKLGFLMGFNEKCDAGSTYDIKESYQKEVSISA